MNPLASREEPDRQLPLGEEIFLDHVGHFVRDAAAASRALAQAGFAPTPVSVQVNPSDGTPTGTGNITAMLRRGYVEVLFFTADTPLGRELEAALRRHPGVHLAAFAVADAAAAHRRLETAGVRMRPLVQMQRPVDTVHGPDVAAFTVARTEPGEMAEGRIQILAHGTEHTVWQPRWLDHPNGAAGLLDLLIVTADPAAAAARFARFLGRPAEENAAGRVVRLDRGRLQLVEPEAFADIVPGVGLPGLPFMAAYGIAVHSTAALEAVLRAGGLAFIRQHGGVLVPFPPALGGGAWVFVQRAADLPWRR